jgi:hypothetical protein
MIVAEPLISARGAPFPHAVAPQLISPELADIALTWLENDAPWRLRTESFYEQYELNLHQVDLPANLTCLISEGTIDQIRQMLAPLTTDALTLVEANAHKLLEPSMVRRRWRHANALFQLRRRRRRETGSPDPQKRYCIRDLSGVLSRRFHDQVGRTVHARLFVQTCPLRPYRENPGFCQTPKA